MTLRNSDLLSALLDTLLPGTHGFPSAAQTRAMERLVRQRDLSERIDALLAALPSNFATLETTARIAIVSGLEARLAAQFQTFLAALYSAYYTDAAVLRIVSDLTGYRQPPQPQGHALAPFDETILATVRSSPPSWRS